MLDTHQQVAVQYNTKPDFGNHTSSKNNLLVLLHQNKCETSLCILPKYNPETHNTDPDLNF